ncbi:hypothetical protein TWF718_000714 [Orbilia javanica]|uniref:Uncharacterized protein n=1 Tax=Orbilia javanica TaxID=47235 RepID=A0AAN8RMJ9_9PEZI
MTANVEQIAVAKTAQSTLSKSLIKKSGCNVGVMVVSKVLEFEMAGLNLSNRLERAGLLVDVK